MKRGLFLLPLLALLLLSTACGSSDSDVLSLDPVASAASLTTDAGSARLGFSMTMKADGRTMKVDGAGAFDFDDSRGTLTMDASALLPAGSGGDGRFELRMIGSKLYMKLPAALGGQAIGGGKPWIGIDVAKTLEAAGLGSINPANLQQDPTQTLRLLRASSTSVEKAGTAKIRGVADDALHGQARPEEVDRGHRGRARPERQGTCPAPSHGGAAVDAGGLEDDPGRRSSSTGTACSGG